MTEEPLVVEMSFAQQSLWLQSEIDPGQSAYNVAAAVRLRGRLDVGRLERALNVVVERHEVLRTTFALDGGLPVQVIRPEWRLTAPVVDTTEEELDRAALAVIETPFDLREGPLVRLSILRLAAEDHVALLVLHHIVTDGTSSAILFRELTGAYAALCAGQEPVLPELPIQYADFAVWQRDRLAGLALEELRAYWSERLTGAVGPVLPTDRPRPPVRTDRGAAIRFDLPPALVERAEALARARGATPFMLFLAAFNLLLSRHCAQDDITVLAPTTGRDRSELEGLIGYFVNPLLLRTDLSGDPDFLELLRRVREGFLGAVRHSELPFEQAVDLLRRHSPATGGEAPRALLVLQAAGRSRWQAAGLDFEMLRLGTESAKLDLALEIRPDETGHHVVLQYSTDVLDEAMAARLGEQFVAVLESVADDPSQRLSEVPLPSAAERPVGQAVEPLPAAAPAPPHRDPDPAAEGPRTPFEEEIARIWAELLGRESVGAHENFFDLGGQSLTAVRLAARLRDDFGVEVPVRELYADFTVAEVAWKVLQRLVADEPAAAAVTAGAPAPEADTRGEA